MHVPLLHRKAPLLQETTIVTSIDNYYVSGVGHNGGELTAVYLITSISAGPKSIASCEGGDTPAISTSKLGGGAT